MYSHYLYMLKVVVDFKCTVFMKECGFMSIQENICLHPQKRANKMGYKYRCSVIASENICFYCTFFIKNVRMTCRRVHIYSFYLMKYGKKSSTELYF